MSRRLKETPMMHYGTRYDYLVVAMRALINYENALTNSELEGQQDGRWGIPYCRRELQIVDELRRMVSAMQKGSPEYETPPALTKKKGGKR